MKTLPVLFFTSQ